MNKKTSRKALLGSLLSLLLCCTMLIGTTFAWFTDEVTSGNNQIIAGNLDIELYDGDGVKVDENTNFFEDIEWEPGVVAYENLTIENLGSLALKYDLSLNWGAYNTVKDTAKSLVDVLKVAVVDGHVAADAKREDLVKGAVFAPLSSNVVSGNLTEQGDTKEVAIVVYWEPSDIDNEYNLKNGLKSSDGEALFVDLGVRLIATQYTHEYDSFGKDYDATAGYSVWDGTSVAIPQQDDNGVYHITNAAELAGINEILVNLVAEGKAHFVLDTNIDLAGYNWSPIGATAAPSSRFEGTFDGQGYTIANVSVGTVTRSVLNGAGLFGFATNSTIENLTVSNVYINGGEWVGGLVGYAMCTEITNCRVISGTVIGAEKVGGVVGHYDTGSLTDCTVDGLTIIASGDRVAGIAGRAMTSEGAAAVKGNVVKNTVVNGEQAAEFVAQILGTAVVENNISENVIIPETPVEMVADGVGKVEERQYQVYNATGLANVGSVISSTTHGEGRALTFTLMADVDMAGEEWSPIHLWWVNFDGNGHTVSNLNCVQAAYGKSGFASYIGGGSITNLTLENVTVAGTQAAVFGGSVEGGKISNCYLKGDNYVTWEQNTVTAGYTETHSGIGAIAGVNQNGTMNVEICEGATVTLNYNDMTTEASYVDELTGYITANKGTVVNNGTVIKAISTAEELVAFAESLNTSGAAVNVVLADDIDLKDVEWPVVEAKRAFTLDGNNKTIYNLRADTVKDDGFGNVGMFCSTYKETVIKDLNMVDAVVVGNRAAESHGAVLIATPRANTLIENCSVIGAKVSDCDRTAALVTYEYFTAIEIKDCKVSDCTLASIGTVGALLGANNGHDFTASGCVVTGNTITCEEGTAKAGVLVGTVNGGSPVISITDTVDNVSGNTLDGTVSDKYIGRDVATSSKITLN